MYFVVQLRLRRQRPARPTRPSTTASSGTTTTPTRRSPSSAYFPYNELLHSTAIDPLGPVSGRSLDLAFDGPDGCHVSPYGSLVLSEDGNTANHLLSWSPGDRRAGDRPQPDRLGAERRRRQRLQRDDRPRFSPDGLLLFGNVQEPGHCLRDPRTLVDVPVRERAGGEVSPPVLPRALRTPGG